MVTVWGLLAKSLTDSETIEEMVDRKIAEHEQDPESHMGEGESIDVHRKTEIIDHPAGSVLFDKLTMREFIFSQAYTTDTLFGGTATYSFYGGNSFTVYTDGDPVAGKMRRRSTPAGVSFTPNKDFSYQAYFNIYDSNEINVNMRFGLGYDLTVTDPQGIFYEVKNGVARIRAQDHLNVYTSDPVPHFVDKNQILRIVYIYGENKLYFYVDGSLVFECPALEYWKMANLNLYSGHETVNQVTEVYINVFEEKFSVSAI